MRLICTVKAPFYLVDMQHDVLGDIQACAKSQQMWMQNSMRQAMLTLQYSPQLLDSTLQTQVRRHGILVSHEHNGPTLAGCAMSAQITCNMMYWETQSYMTQRGGQDASYIKDQHQDRSI